MEWEQTGYLVLRDILQKDLLKVIDDYLRIQARKGGLGNDGISRFSRYGDSLTESLLLHCLPIVEKYSRKKMYPTYSYVRIYKKGDILKAHTDREACEYSMTLPIAYRSRNLWPIFVRPGRKKINILLDKGDLLLYKGCDVPHGRDTFPGTSWTQVFLHYVDAKGPHAKWKFDKRKSI